MKSNNLKISTMKKEMSPLQSHYFRQKGRVTIMTATAQAYLQMPHTFSGHDLHRQAARELLRPSVYPDTILRALRYLRTTGKVQCVCIDPINSIYRKGL